jgi:hypothetical protein
MLTDDEFLSAISKLQINILYEKARQLVKRPATRAEQIAYERGLVARRAYEKAKSKKRLREPPSI